MTKKKVAINAIQQLNANKTYEMTPTIIGVLYVV